MGRRSFSIKKAWPLSHAFSAKKSGISSEIRNYFLPLLSTSPSTRPTAAEMRMVWPGFWRANSLASSTSSFGSLADSSLNLSPAAAYFSLCEFLCLSGGVLYLLAVFLCLHFEIS